MNSRPLISVVLPVYNAGVYLKEAIESVLNQSYPSFEFIIINDGSTDDSEQVIKSYTDKRIKYIKQENKGLGATLNQGLLISNGKYIARQDQDDISYPTRFEKQINFLEANKDVVLLGTRAKVKFENSTELQFHNHATQASLLKFDLIFDNPFVHSSVMFRKNMTEKAGIYNTDRSIYEDYDLWSRFSHYGKVANLSEVLLDYRHHEGGMSKNTANFREYALFNQGVKNATDLLVKKEIAIIDAIAVYHWKKEKYSNSGIKKMEEGLDAIAKKITEHFPNDADLIENRKNQYVKVLKYRLNLMARENAGFFKLLLLVAEAKLNAYPSGVINE